MQKVVITLTNNRSDYDLQFDLLDTSITQKWLKHLALFIDSGQPWDDIKRFYNFPNSAYTHDSVVEHLRYLVRIINNYSPGLVDRNIAQTITQDDLKWYYEALEEDKKEQEM